MMQEKNAMESKPARPADGADRTLDVLRFEGGALRAIFAPKSVAVIGATEKEGRVGRTVLSNLIGSPFGGTVYPVNIRRRTAAPPGADRARRKAQTHRRHHPLRQRRHAACFAQGRIQAEAGCMPTLSERM